MPTDDDDDLDDRPRRRYRDDRPRKGMSTTVIALLIGGAVVVVACPVVAILAGLMLPAVQKVREAADRSNDMNNLKELGLAQHNFAGGHNDALVGPVAYDPLTKQVRSGNSFRVSLLPYVQQDALYRRFDLAVSWDNARNKPASDTVLKVFGTPSAAPTNPTDTPYRVFHGGGALFETDGTPVPFRKISDGTSNTILMVHAEQQVPWAKPDELKYSPTAPLPPLGAKGGKGFNVLMADGSVRFVSSSVGETTLRKLITRGGGEAINPGEF